MDVDKLNKIKSAKDYERIQTYRTQAGKKVLGPVLHRSESLRLEFTEQSQVQQNETTTKNQDESSAPVRRAQKSE